MEESNLLNDIIKTEEQLKLYDDTLLGIPLWRIVRYHSRLNYLTKKTGYLAGSSVVKIGKPRIKFISGFWGLLGKHNISMFFSFNRLVRCNDCYLDKFVDPVIFESEIENQNYVIIDPPNYIGDYKRAHKQNTISNEGRTIFAQFLKYWFKLIVHVRYARRINRLFNKSKEAFLLSNSYRKVYFSEIAGFLANYNYYLFWLKRIKPDRVFVVYREGYFPQIAVCKKLGIPIAEFQHGITLDKTVSFTGSYDIRIDPDYFLTFGEYWKGNQFGMPLDRMVNIGWAYSKFLAKQFANVNKNNDNDVLVISSPEISDAILDALTELSKSKGDFRFHIRLHPCESYNEKQKEKLANIPCAEVVDNKIDSAIVLPTYKHVVGENSSVIYEALSMGCKVGMLNLCGLRPAVDLPGIKESFYVINNADDFEKFLSNRETSNNINGGFYSRFDGKEFMDFVEKSM